jgi:hypothetical protein
MSAERYSLEIQSPDEGEQIVAEVQPIPASLWARLQGGRPVSSLVESQDAAEPAYGPEQPSIRPGVEPIGVQENGGHPVIEATEVQDGDLAGAAAGQGNAEVTEGQIFKLVH